MTLQSRESGILWTHGGMPRGLTVTPRLPLTAADRARDLADLSGSQALSLRLARSARTEVSRSFLLVH